MAPGRWRRASVPRACAERVAATELAFQSGFGKTRLPKAAIHADLFCDNVLFNGDAVVGIIDFGFAATDFLAYDIAIAVNDWCDAGDGSIDGERMRAFVTGYHAVRPIEAEEREQWPALLRAAALRFWLSRLYDMHLPRHGELTHAHDPARFERILEQRIAAMPRLPELD